MKTLTLMPPACAECGGQDSVARCAWCGQPKCREHRSVLLCTACIDWSESSLTFEEEVDARNAAAIRRMAGRSL